VFCGPDQENRMRKIIIRAAASLLFGALSLFAQGNQIFKGEITQCRCVESDSRAAEPCDAACPGRGVRYDLADATKKVAYHLDNQILPKPFVARQVLVIGTLDPAVGTIHVAGIVGALPARVVKAKSVYIDCDACVRDMTKARLAAFQDLTAWKRFAVVSDPHKADLIFLFSANPYLGDYLTRDGPDRRLVRLGITYMNIVDPKTGISLWGDSRKAGSWFVAEATNDLIGELREQLEEDQNPAERQLFLKRYQARQSMWSAGK
jgi:hypothetical protein